MAQNIMETFSMISLMASAKSNSQMVLSILVNLSKVSFLAKGNSDGQMVLSMKVLGETMK